jgi:hypothetical protein
MTLYVVGITGNDLNRNRRLALHIQGFLDQTYKEFYKTPNYRKYLQVFVENLSKSVISESLNNIEGLWDSIFEAKLFEFVEISKKKPTYDFYIIVPDVKTANQLSLLRQFDSTIIFNFETIKPEDNIDYLSYKMLNIKRNFLTGKQTCYLEYMYTKDDIWYCHNKPEHYMKEFAKALVNDFNHERIYHGKNV